MLARGSYPTRGDCFGDTGWHGNEDERITAAIAREQALVRQAARELGRRGVRSFHLPTGDVLRVKLIDAYIEVVPNDDAAALSACSLQKPKAVVDLRAHGSGRAIQRVVFGTMHGQRQKRETLHDRMRPEPTLINVAVEMGERRCSLPHEASSKVPLRRRHLCM